MKQINIQIKVTLLIGVMIFLGGCFGNQNVRYSGDHLTEATRATLKPWKNGTKPGSPGSLIVLPVSIDNIEVDIPSRDKVSITKYFIAPGERAIKAVLFANIAGKKKQVIDPDPMIFQAKTGHVYITKASFKIINQENIDTKIKFGFWIEDESNGEVVSGTRLTE